MLEMEKKQFENFKQLKSCVYPFRTSQKILSKLNSEHVDCDPSLLKKEETSQRISILRKVFMVR